MAESETYLFTNVGQITVPEPLASKINAIRKRRDGWWDQRFSAGKQAANWFDFVDFLAIEVFVRGGEISAMPLPDLEEKLDFPVTRVSSKAGGENAGVLSFRSGRE